MRELVRTTEPVLISFIEATLRSGGVVAVLADQFTSGIEGSIGAFPRRILVAEGDYALARRLLIEAGLGGHLVAAPPP
jgi:Putative prokaryotic signal transducing protein